MLYRHTRSLLLALSLSLGISISQPTIAQPATQPLPQRNNTLWIGIGLGGGILVLLAHAFLIWHTKQQRQKTLALIPDLERKLQSKTAEALDLLQTADFSIVANYTGETGQIVQTAAQDLQHCLDLLDGGKKIVNEAKRLLEDGSLGSILYPFGVNRAHKLLTDRKTTYTFTPAEQAQALVGASDRPPAQITISLPDLLNELERKQKTAQQILKEVMQKDAEIANFLQRIAASARSLVPSLETLQAQPIKDFTAQQVYKTLIPHIVGTGGLIDQSQGIMQKDPVGAWNNYGKVGERIVREAQAIIAICEQAQRELIPQTEEACSLLSAHGLKTDWILRTRKELSDQLDQLTVQAINTAVSGAVDAFKQDIGKFQQRLRTTRQQDEQRRITFPTQISDTIATIASTREQIASIYQRQGIALSSDAALREIDRDPSALVAEAQKLLHDLKVSLDEGDTVQADQQIQQLQNLLESSRQLCADSLTFLNNYTSEVNKVRHLQKSITDKIDLNYRPIAQQLQRNYHPEALVRVANELNSPPNILERVENQMHTVAQSLIQADQEYQRGWLLTSRDQLQEATTRLQGSEKLLELLVQIQQTLECKEQQARSALSRLQDDVRYLLNRQHQYYVRDRARRLCLQLEQQLQEMNQLINSTPKHPYRLEELLAQLAQAQTEAKRELDNDEHTYDRARREISQVESQFYQTEQAIDDLRRQSFRYATVNFYRTDLDSERRELREIKQMFDHKEFESSAQRASDLYYNLQRLAEDARRALEDARREEERQSSYQSYDSSYQDRDHGGSSSGTW